MFSKETYISRRAALREKVGSGILLFLGNNQVGMNYEGNEYDFRQDSSFLYFWAWTMPGWQLSSMQIPARKSSLATSSPLTILSGLAPCRPSRTMPNWWVWRKPFR